MLSQKRLKFHLLIHATAHLQSKSSTTLPIFFTSVPLSRILLSSQKSPSPKKQAGHQTDKTAQSLLSAPIRLTYKLNGVFMKTSFFTNCEQLIATVAVRCFYAEQIKPPRSYTEVVRNYEKTTWCVIRGGWYAKIGVSAFAFFLRKRVVP